MTKLTSHSIFPGCLPNILDPELNFGLDELLNGKEIGFLCISLAVVADILFVNAVEQSEPIKFVISCNVGLGFSIKLVHFSVKRFTFSIGKVRVMLIDSFSRPKNSSFLGCRQY